MLSESRLVLVDLLRLELGPAGLGEVELLDEVEVARADSGARRSVHVTLGFVDSDERDKTEAADVRRG